MIYFLLEEEKAALEAAFCRLGEARRVADSLAQNEILEGIALQIEEGGQVAM